MRPKKRILLAGANDTRLSILKFMLETNHYFVVEAIGASEANGLLRAPQPWDLLLCDWPMDGAESLLRTCAVPTLVLAASVKEAPEWMQPFGTFTRGYSTAELLDRIKVLTARKRGPRKGMLRKPPVSVGTNLAEARVA